MKRGLIATPLFRANLTLYLDNYAELGAVRFIDHMKTAYRNMCETLIEFPQIGAIRRRNVNGQSVTLHEYVLKVESRDFLILYHIPSTPEQPIVLVNIRIGGQNQFRWT